MKVSRFVVIGMLFASSFAAVGGSVVGVKAAGATSSCNTSSAPTSWTQTPGNFANENATTFTTGTSQTWFAFNGSSPNKRTLTSSNETDWTGGGSDQYVALNMAVDTTTPPVLYTAGVGDAANGFGVGDGQPSAFDWCARFTSNPAVDTAFALFPLSGHAWPPEIDLVEAGGGSVSLNLHWNSDTDDTFVSDGDSDDTEGVGSEAADGTYHNGVSCNHAAISSESGGTSDADDTISDCAATFGFTLSNPDAWHEYQVLWTATSVELWVDGTLEVTATDANCSANVPSDGMDSGTEPCIPTGTGMYFSMQQSSLDGTTIPTDPSDLAWESGFHVTNGNTVNVTNPGTQTGSVGTSASLQIPASDSAGGQTLTYSATGLPAGLSINASTGLISGTPTLPGTSSVTVSATDTTGASGSASFGWTVNSAANTVTVTNPGSQTGTVGTSASLQIHASDSASGQTLTYGATGLPAGLSINASTGLISGMPTIATSYSVTVKAKDATGASGSATFSWVISASGGGIVNGGFETGTLSGWTPSGPKTGVTTYRPHSGTYAAVLGSTSPTNGSSSITQTFVAPSGTSTLHVWYNLTCPGSLSREWATATLKDNTTSTTKVLMKVCVQSSGWVQVTASVNPGQSYTLTLTSHDDNRAGDPTHTRYDDVSLS